MKMSKIPTAEEVCNKQFFGFKGELWVGVHKAMIEFAKLHVEAALKEAGENAFITNHKPTLEDDRVYKKIDKDSILNAYPLDNIK